MGPPRGIVLLYLCSLILTSCTSSVRADSVALVDTGFQSDLLCLTSVTAGRTVGWEFTATRDIWVTQLGFFDLGQDGLNIAHDIGIWSVGPAEPQLLVSATIPSAQGASLLGEYRYVSVPYTLLSAGQTLVIGATIAIPTCEPGFEPDFYPNNTIQLDPANIVLDSRVSLVAANRCSEDSTTDILELDFPSEDMLLESFTDPLTGDSLTIEYYFLAPNFVFSESNPEPTTLMFLVTGAAAVLASSSRRRRDSQLGCRQLGGNYLYPQKEGGCPNEKVRK